MFVHHGSQGMLPRSRARSPLRSLADREELSRGLMAGESLRQIAEPPRGFLERPSRYVSRVAGREDGDPKVERP